MRWSNAVMQRMAGTQIRVGRPLVHSARDPDLLACVKGALEKREVRTGRASSLAPGRIFEVNAAPLPVGRRHRRAARRHPDRSRGENRAANSSPTSATSCVRRLPPFRATSRRCSKTPAAIPKRIASFWQSSRKTLRRMNRLTEDLLALASVESPDYKLARQPIRASALVHDAIESLGGLVVDSGVELEFAGAPDALFSPTPMP